MSEQELIDAIERCWNAASKADILLPPMEMGTGLDGRPALNQMRYSIFQALLQTQTLPRRFDHRTETPREPWQE